MKRRDRIGRHESPPGGHNVETARAITLDVDRVIRMSVFDDADEARPAVSQTVCCHPIATLLNVDNNNVKAKIKAISSDVHQLQLIKLHQFKVEGYKSIQ